ncbi:MAG: nucleotidyltransferase domain-containing protein [Aggregatilineales bacterium]
MSENTQNLLSQCQYPPLETHYDIALRQAVAYIINRFDPIGIIASGSIVRGNPSANSDFDIHVIHDNPYRQRIQKFFAGVPCEIFVNPPQRISTYFTEENQAGRPSTAHMFSTGFVVLDTSPIITDLITEAQQFLQKPPEISATRLQFLRYMIADSYENALDIQDENPAMALLLMSDIMTDLLRYYFWSRGQNLPRHKDMLTVLAEQDETLSGHFRDFHLQPIQARFQAAAALMDMIVGVRGFFEWESDEDLLR